MWAILLGRPTIEIAHFERMGLDGFFSNFLILTREQAFRGRERNNLLMHAYYDTLAHSLFFLFGSFFLSKFPVFPLIIFFFFYHLCFSSPFLCSSLFCPYYAQLRPFFILPVVMGIYCFVSKPLLSQYSCPSQTTHWSVGCPTITTYLYWPCHISFPNKRVLFCFLAHRGILIQIRVGIFSYYPLWHAPSDSSLSFSLLSGMSSQQDISPKRA